jgi:hypothetical protein
MTAFDDVFDPAMLDRAARKLPVATPLLRHRYRVLRATEVPDGDAWSQSLERDHIAERRAWANYIEAADAVGLLDRDLRERLRGDDPTGFRSGHAECLTAWYFHRHLGLAVTPRPVGREGKLLDLRVVDGGTAFNVEVKAPESIASAPRRVGNDAELLADQIRNANKQLPDEEPNLVVIVPTIEIPVAHDRYQFVDAFIGQTVIRLGVSAGVDAADEDPPTPAIKFNGHFVRPKSANVDDGPAYRRISAVLVLEEKFVRTNGLATEPPAENTTSPGLAVSRQLNDRVSAEDCRVVPLPIAIHNPYAHRPIAPALLGDCPQLIAVDGCLVWTDQLA